MGPDPHDDPRDIDERDVEVTGEREDVLREPLDSVPAWWGPLVDASDQQQLDAVELDFGKYLEDFGEGLLEGLLEFAKTGPRRRFLVCDTLQVSHWAGVYIAIDCVADRAVVLKISRHAIDREGRIAVTASHPNVVTVHDTFVCQGHPTMVLEWCRQGTLSACGRFCGDWKIVLARAIEAGRGLAHCHAQGKVHGDVKPTNILIADDIGKLADFGIARSETQDGEIVASWAFAPPERDWGEWTRAGDVYSYAATLLTALQRFRVPKHVHRILKAGMVRAPDRRPTMTTLLTDLERALDHAPSKRERGRRWAWAQLGLVVVCAAIVTSSLIEGMCAPPEGPIDTTLELAAEAVAEGEGEAAIKYLEAARSRARRNFDRHALRLVAARAEELGHHLAKQADDVHAAESWGVAQGIFLELGDREAVARVKQHARGLSWR